MQAGPLGRLLGRRVLRLLIGIMILIEAIFIAESFTTLLENVVQSGGTAWQLAILLLLKSPEIVDFALPIGLMIAVYLAVIGARDDNELVICAASGVPWWRVLSVVVIIGAVGFATSLLFTGMITPSAQYLSRVTGHTLELRRIEQHLLEPGTRRLLQEVRGSTVIALPGSTEHTGRLFLFDETGGETWRFSQSDEWSGEGPDQDGSIKVRLRSYNEYVFGEDASNLGGLQGKLPTRFGLANVQTEDLAIRVRREELLPPFDAARRDHEQWLAWHFNQNVPTEGLARKFVAAVMCPLAVLFALACGIWSATKLGRWFALPVATVCVMASDMALRALVPGAIGHGAFWGIAVILPCVAGLGPFCYVVWMRDAVFLPARVRG